MVQYDLQEAEVEFERVMSLLDRVVKEKLQQATARISELESANAKFLEENSRLAKDNRELYGKCEMAYRTVSVTQEQRAALEEYRRK